jgi:hypothetical protein
MVPGLLCCLGVVMSGRSGFGWLKKNSCRSATTPNPRSYWRWGSCTYRVGSRPTTPRRDNHADRHAEHDAIQAQIKTKNAAIERYLTASSPIGCGQG